MYFVLLEETAVLVINIVNIVLHSVGTYALISLYGGSRNKPQRIYLINLGICEDLMSFMWVIRSLFWFTATDHYHYQVHFVYNIVYVAGFRLVHHLNMMYITGDRLTKVLLNVKYGTFWDETKTKCLIVVTWLIAIISALCASLSFNAVEYMEKHNWYIWDFLRIVIRYIIPMFDVTFVITALVTYILIVRKKISSKRVQRPGVKKSKYVAFKKPIFIVPALLISNFMLFTVVPDITVLCLYDRRHNINDVAINAVNILFSVSFLADAIIYIFLLPDVRKFLLGKFKKLCHCCVKSQHEEYLTEKTEAVELEHILPELPVVADIPLS